MNMFEINDDNMQDDEFEVSQCMINNVILTEGEAPSMEVKFKNYYTGDFCNVTLKVDKITPNSLKKCILKNNGLCLDGELVYSKLMKEYCKAVANKTVDVYQSHKKVGWYKVNELPVFWGHTAVTSVPDMHSEYDGKLDISPKGDINNVRSMIENHVLSCKEWSPLQAVIAFSVGATILPFARMEWGVELNNVIVHLLGGSTSGKSTALKLHAGLGANVSDRNKGFWITHESSLVSIIRRIGYNTGYPVSIDELSTASRREYDEFVYALGNGEEKDRMKAGGNGLQDSASFNTVILSSGELSILRKCSANEGIRARCIEIPNVHWTESKEQANAISKCVRSNHGLMPPLVADELLKNSDVWRDRWNQLDKKVQDKITKDKIFLSIVPRVADFVTLFTLAAEIANKVLDINFDVEKIFDFCYEYIIIANAEEANLAQRAYDYLLEYYSKNRSAFALGENYGCKSFANVYYLDDTQEGFTEESNVRARTINGVVYDKRIVFRKSAIERILDTGGYSVKVALNKLSEARYLLVKDNRRNTIRRTINDIEQDVVAVYYRDDALTGVAEEDKLL